MALIDLVRELCSLNDDNLVERVIKDSDVQWCLSELLDILEQEENPNGPLALDELQKMDGQPMWVKELNRWALVMVVVMMEIHRKLPFILFADGNTRTWNVETRKLHCYRRPPEGKTDA